MPLLPLLAALAIAPADTVRLVLVATTDVHGYVTEWDYLQNTAWPGGFARAATVVDSLRIRYPGQVILVDAGDAINGSPLSSYVARVAPRDPHPAIEAMNLLGYDAATPGDRDFDYGVEFFQKTMAGAAFQWVSGNIQALPADTNLYPTYTVVTRKGVRVGITGFTTPGAMIWNGDKLRNRLRVKPIEPALQPILREMRQDADLSIVLLHSGLDGPSSYDTTGVGPEQVGARLVNGSLRPDLVVVGHTNGDIRDTVLNGVHFVQPRSDGRGLIVVQLTLASKAGGGYGLLGMKAERVLLDESAPSIRITRRLSDPHESLLRWSARTIAESDRRLSLAGARVEDTQLMRLLHDVQRNATRADLSAVAVADPRAAIEEGEVHQGDVVRVYPWDYTLRAVRISGAQLRAFLEQSARYFYADSTGRVATNRFVLPANYDVIGGAQYTFDLSQPMGARVSRLLVRGRAVAPTDSFTLALSSYRQQGSGNYSMLNGARVVYDKGEYIRDLLTAEIVRRRTLTGATTSSADFVLTPSDLAAKARAIFVREPAPVAAAPVPAPLNFPTTPTERELARRDSVTRVQERKEAEANQSIATLRLPAESEAGKALPRLLADAYRNIGRADVGLAHFSEVGSSLPPTGLAAAQIAAAAPGEQRLIVLTLSGRDLMSVLEHVVEGGAACCEIAGLRVTYDSTAKPLERLRDVKLQSGKSLDGKQKYRLAISTALVEADSVFVLGGTDCRAGKGCKTAGRLSRFAPETTDRTASLVLQDYLRRLPQPVTPPSDRRLTPRR